MLVFQVIIILHGLPLIKIMPLKTSNHNHDHSEFLSDATQLTAGLYDKICVHSKMLILVSCFLWTSTTSYSRY